MPNFNVHFIVREKKCNVSNISISLSLCLSPSPFSGVKSRWGGNHGATVAVCDAGSCHSSTGTELSEALCMSDPVTQPGNPLCQERSTVCTNKH